jgi:hypothetical protein
MQRLYSIATIILELTGINGFSTGTNARVWADATKTGSKVQADWEILHAKIS